MLDLGFDIQPDDDGVFNGVELAEQLIASAAMLLAPYTAQCPACLNDLFGNLANVILDTMHEHREQQGHFPEQFLTTAGIDGRQVREKHLAACRKMIENILGARSREHTTH